MPAKGTERAKGTKPPSWARKRVIVEIPVRNDVYSEHDLMLDLLNLLGRDGFRGKLQRLRHAPQGKVGNIVIKSYNKAAAYEARQNPAHEQFKNLRAILDEGLTLVQMLERTGIKRKTK